MVVVYAEYNVIVIEKTRFFVKVLIDKFNLNKYGNVKMFSFFVFLKCLTSKN